MYRYIGNKTKLLPHIMNRVREMIGDTGTVADIMAGTGSVALELKKNGYTVVASDVMTYSYHHLVTNLQLDGEPPFTGLIFEGVIDAKSTTPYQDVLEFLNNLTPKQSFFYREFSPAGTPLNANALKAVVSDRNVYAAFTSTVRKYTIRFYNGTTLVQTVSDVPYGSNASYTGDTPAKTDVEKPEDYEFTGWNPSPIGITGNTDCYAQYRFIGFISVGIVERSISGDYSNDRVTTVGVCAFQSCSGLTSVSFPNVTAIGDYAFNAAHNLVKADLPKVTSIGQHGFSAANALEALILRNTEKVCSLGSDAVSYTKISSGSGYIYVPAALVDSYKAAANWQNYADQIRAIEDYPEITGGES